MLNINTHPILARRYAASMRKMLLLVAFIAFTTFSFFKALERCYGRRCAARSRFYFGSSCSYSECRIRRRMYKRTNGRRHRLTCRLDRLESTTNHRIEIRLMRLHLDIGRWWALYMRTEWCLSSRHEQLKRLQPTPGNRRPDWMLSKPPLPL